MLNTDNTAIIDCLRMIHVIREKEIFGNVSSSRIASY